MNDHERNMHDKLVMENKRLEECVLMRDGTIERLERDLEVKTKMLDKYVNLLIRVIEKFV